jgi:CHASE3 domain sensor protein
MRNVSLSAKMCLGFGIPLLMIAAIVTANYVVVNRVQSSARLAKDESVIFAGIARQMKLDVVQVQQWLTDISATRAQDGLDDGFDEAENSSKSFLAGLAKFKEMFEQENDSTGLQQVKELESAFTGYYEAGKKMAQAYIDGGSEAGNKMMASFDEAATELSNALEPFVESQVTELDEAMASIVSSSGTLRNMVLVTGIVALALGVLGTSIKCLTVTG